MSADPARCTACRLCEARTQVVLPDGAAGGLLAVGEAPGRDEDLQGVGFVGRAGRTLDGVLLELGLHRADYDRTNEVRCRPPENRKPRRDEVQACSGWLQGAVNELQPRVILAVGQSAAEQLLTLPRQPYLEFVVATLQGSEPLQRYGGVSVVPMPHTSPLAWNRRRADGTALRDIGARAAAQAVSVLAAAGAPARR